MTAIEWTTRLLRRGAATTAAAPGTSRYLMRRRIALAHDDIPVENEEGVLAFSVDGEAMRPGRTLIVRDQQLQSPVPHPRADAAPEGVHGDRTGRGRHGRDGQEDEARNLARPLDRDPPRPGESRAGCSFGAPSPSHEYRIVAVDRQVAEVSKRWFRLRNTYGVAIPAGEDEALLLTIAAAVDQMAR